MPMPESDRRDDNRIRRSMNQSWWYTFLVWDARMISARRKTLLAERICNSSAVRCKVGVDNRQDRADDLSDGATKNRFVGVTGRAL